MKCNKVHKLLIPYINGKTSTDISEIIGSHLESCKSCSELYNEVRSTFELTERKRPIEPNPFMYTRIRQRLENIEEINTQKQNIRIFKKVYQPVIMSLILTLAVFSGIKLGNAFDAGDSKKIIFSKNTEYYLNDIQQERLEVILLKD